MVALARSRLAGCLLLHIRHRLRGPILGAVPPAGPSSRTRRAKQTSGASRQRARAAAPEHPIPSHPAFRLSLGVGRRTRSAATAQPAACCAALPAVLCSVLCRATRRACSSSSTKRRSRVRQTGPEALALEAARCIHHPASAAADSSPFLGGHGGFHARAWHRARFRLVIVGPAHEMRAIGRALLLRRGPSGTPRRFPSRRRRASH